MYVTGASKFAAAAAVAASAAAAQPQPAVIPPGWDTGNCVSGRITFNKDRSFLLPPGTGDTARFGVDRSKFDWTVDYNGATNIEWLPTGAANLLLTPAQPTDPSKLARGIRLSSTMYLRYGKITGRFTPLTDNGVVTTMITWSDVQGVAVVDNELTQDEIDLEVLGYGNDPQYNIFTYKTKALERGLHGGTTGAQYTPGQPHEFSIDWRSDSISWGLDGAVIKTVTKDSSRAITPLAGLGPNDAWFPVSPSRIQLSVWESPSLNWAHGPLNFNGRPQISSMFEWIQVQCYDDNNNPVARWSTTGGPPSNVTTTTAAAATTTATTTAATTATGASTATPSVKPPGGAAADIAPAISLLGTVVAAISALLAL